MQNPRLRFTCLLLLLALSPSACLRAGTGGLPSIGIGELAEALASGSPPVVVDANGEDTRARLGVIPGAKLLSSYRDYALDELPADRSRALVFYCYSAMCTAARDAALRAHEAGYRRVAIMSEGIRGWVDAGRAVEPGEGGRS